MPSICICCTIRENRDSANQHLHSSRLQDGTWLRLGNRWMAVTRRRIGLSGTVTTCHNNTLHLSSAFQLACMVGSLRQRDGKGGINLPTCNWVMRRPRGRLRDFLQTSHTVWSVLDQHQARTSCPFQAMTHSNVYFRSPNSITKHWAISGHPDHTNPSMQHPSLLFISRGCKHSWFFTLMYSMH